MIAPAPPQQPANESMSHSPVDGDDDPSKNGGRVLSTNKRAEQNRKAQRAFRERREQHVKLLQSRSELLETALQSADEANRRWEECRVLVEQLRAENVAIRGENASLRQALVNARLLPAGTPNGASPAPMGNGVGGVGEFDGSQERKADPDAGKAASEGNNAEPATTKA